MVREETSTCGLALVCSLEAERADGKFWVKIDSALGRSEMGFSSLVFLLLRTVERIVKPWKPLIFAV